MCAVVGRNNYGNQWGLRGHGIECLGSKIRKKNEVWIWIVGLLDCWIVGLLDCWTFGLLVFWIRLTPVGRGLLWYIVVIKGAKNSSGEYGRIWGQEA